MRRLHMLSTFGSDPPADHVELASGAGYDEVVVKPVVLSTRTLAQHVSQPKHQSLGSMYDQLQNLPFPNFS
jgi:hypothetical protein